MLPTLCLKKSATSPVTKDQHTAFSVNSESQKVMIHSQYTSVFKLDNEFPLFCAHKCENQKKLHSSRDLCFAFHEAFLFVKTF